MRIAKLYPFVIVLLGFLYTGIPAQPAVAQVAGKAQLETKLGHSSTSSRSYEIDERFNQWREQMGRSPKLEAAIANFKRIKGLEDYTPGKMIRTAGEPAFSKSTGSFANMQQLPVPGSNEYAYPSMVTADNGDLVMAFKDWGVFPQFWDGPPTDPAKLYLTRSTDGGATWGPAQLVAEGDFPLDFNFLSLTKLGSGRLLLNDLVAFEADHYYYSDDNGLTWTSTAIVEYQNPGWHGPIAGKVWHTFTNETTGASIYRTTDDGVAWSTTKVLLANPNQNKYYQVVTGVAEGEEAPFVLATVERYDFDTGTVATLVMKSTNSGTTWTEVGILPVGGLELSVSSMKTAGDGSIWIVGQGALPWEYPQANPFDYTSDIYYMSSFDFGETWTAPTAFTQYPGEDYVADIAFTPGGPIIAFSSDRIGTGGIFYGLAGTTSDSDAPSSMQPWDFPYGWVPGNEVQHVLVIATAPGGLSGVDVMLTVDGIESVLPLTSGGGSCGSYGLDAAICWASSIGPFSPGADISAVIRTTQTNSTVREFDVGEIAVLWNQLQSAGNVDVMISNTGYLESVVWPSGGNNYIYGAGPWIANGASETAVAEWGWTPSGGFVPTSGPGESDQDVQVAFNDYDDVIGIDVVQRSYQWAETALRNGIVIELEYTNTSGAAIPEFFAGFHADADILEDLYFDDLIAFSSADNVLYMRDSGIECVTQSVTCPNGYIGMAILRDASGAAGKQGGVVPHTASWDQQDGTMFEIMTAGINPALTSGTPITPDDYRMILTAQPFGLQAGESKSVTFAIVMGGSLQDLSAAVTALSAAYDTRVTAVEPEPAAGVPSTYALEQNYPNPFNPSTTIRFDVPATSKVNLVVFDMLGRRVATLVDGVLAAGSYSASFDAKALPTGAYVYRLDTPLGTLTKSMILVK